MAINIKSFERENKKKIRQITEEKANEYFKNFIDDSMNKQNEHPDNTIEFYDVYDIKEKFSKKFEALKIKKVENGISLSGDPFFIIPIRLNNKCHYSFKLLIVIGTYQIGFWCGKYTGVYYFFYRFAYKKVLNLISDFIENSYSDLNKIINEIYENNYVSGKSIEIINNTIVSVLKSKMKLKNIKYSYYETLESVKINYDKNKKYEVFYKDFANNPKPFLDFLDDI